MTYYFKLQYRIFRRSMEESGMPFIVGLVLLLALLLAFYHVVMLRYVLVSQVLVPYLSLSLLFFFSDKQRVDFLRTAFSKKQFYRLRLLENIVTVLPLVLLACAAGYWLSAVLSLLFVWPFTFFKPIGRWKGALPTPFRRYPFEFIIFFRKRLWLLLLMAALLSIAIYVDNVNLSLGVFAAVCLTIVGEVYHVIEPEIILWNFNKRPGNFLKQRFYRGLLQFVVLLLPYVLALVLFFSAQLIWIALGVFMGSGLLLMLLLMKYAIYPRQAGLPEMVAMFIALTPVGFLVLIYYYFRKAKRNLERYHD